MKEELDFSLPSHDRKSAQSNSKWLPILMAAILIAVLINIGIMLIRGDDREDKPKGGMLSAEIQKQLALKLEKQGLNMASAAAWKEYLSVASPGDKDAAMIWYRIGKLYQKDNQYDMALDSFYRSESFARLEDISPEIARRIQECLEAMGKFAALRYELADRVGIKSSASDDESGAGGDQVVAEIGSHKIMKSDLDHRIEYQIDRQISQVASFLPEEQLNKKKEDLLKRFSTNTQRRHFLNQFILEEVLYRKARESSLMDDPDVRTALKDQERRLLAGKVIEKEFAGQIKITPGDLETYYEAHKQEYIRPERAKISHILVSDKVDAKKIRKRLESGEDFNSLAAEMSRDASTRKEGGKISDWIENTKGFFIPGIGDSDDARRVIFVTDAGEVVGEDIKTDKGIHIIKVLMREPERKQTFDEVKNEAFLALRSRKEGEVQQQLLDELKEQYDVVIHQSAFAGNNESDKQ